MENEVLTLAEAKGKVRELLKRAENISDDILNDGGETGDVEQNRRYYAECLKIDGIASEMRKIEIKGANPREMEALRGELDPFSLPENALKQIESVAEKILAMSDEPFEEISIYNTRYGGFVVEYWHGKQGKEHPDAVVAFTREQIEKMAMDLLESDPKIDYDNADDAYINFLEEDGGVFDHIQLSIGRNISESEFQAIARGMSLILEILEAHWDDDFDETEEEW